MTARPYFGYGANLNRLSFRDRCPSARCLGPAVLPDHRFRITRCGYATAVPEPGARVHGLLWTLSPADETELDQFEGMGEGLYAKREPVVTRPDGSQAAAMIYVATDPTPGAPHPGYLEDILASAEREGFPRAYLDELQGWRRTTGPAPS